MAKLNWCRVAIAFYCILCALMVAAQEPDTSTEAAVSAQNFEHYYNATRKPGGWFDENGNNAPADKQKWFDENLAGYEKPTWVDVNGKDVYFTRASDTQRAHLSLVTEPTETVPIYKKQGAAWVDQTFAPAHRATAVTVTTIAEKRTERSRACTATIAAIPDPVQGVCRAPRGQAKADRIRTRAENSGFESSTINS